MPRPHPAASYERCPACGKKTYPSRSAARKAAKALHPNERLNAYRCPRHLQPGDRDQEPAA